MFGWTYQHRYWRTHPRITTTTSHCIFKSAEFDDEFYYVNLPYRAIEDSSKGTRRILLTAELAGWVTADLFIHVILDGKLYGEVRLNPMQLTSSAHSYRLASFAEQVTQQASTLLLAIPAAYPDETLSVTARYCYISGTPKSGTTWLENILNLDARSMILHEGHTTDYFDVTTADPDFLDRSAEWDFVDWYPSKIDKAQVLGTVRASISKFILEHYQTMWGAEVAGDRTPGVTKVLGSLMRAWGRPKAIHIVRNPLDVAVSWMFHELNFHRDGKAVLIPSEYIEEVASLAAHRPGTAHQLIGARLVKNGVFEWIFSEWCADQTEALALRERYPDRVLLVRYEDLLANPATGIRQLYQFLDYEVSEEQLAELCHNADFKRFSGGRQAGQKDSNSFFRSGVAGDYLNYFDAEAQTLMLEYCGELAARFGYDYEIQRATNLANAERVGVAVAETGTEQ
jgi:hypothetical protein